MQKAPPEIRAYYEDHLKGNNITWTYDPKRKFVVNVLQDDNFSSPYFQDLINTEPVHPHPLSAAGKRKRIEDWQQEIKNRTHYLTRDGWVSKESLNIKTANP